MTENRKNAFSVPLGPFPAGHVSAGPLPYGEIDRPGCAPKIGAAVLFSHGLYEHSNDRGVALEVAGPSIPEKDVEQGEGKPKQFIRLATQLQNEYNVSCPHPRSRTHVDLTASSSRGL